MKFDLPRLSLRQWLGLAGALLVAAVIGAWTALTISHEYQTYRLTQSNTAAMVQLLNYNLQVGVLRVPPGPPGSANAGTPPAPVSPAPGPGAHPASPPAMVPPAALAR